MNFQTACEWLARKKHVRRYGWRGYLRMNDGGQIVYCEQYGVTPENLAVTDWRPYIHDIFAEDWQLVDAKSIV